VPAILCPVVAVYNGLKSPLILPVGSRVRVGRQPRLPGAVDTRTRPQLPLTGPDASKIKLAKMPKSVRATL
jgi:hypothetical protein